MGPLSTTPHRCLLDAVINGGSLYRHGGMWVTKAHPEPGYTGSRYFAATIRALAARGYLKHYAVDIYDVTNEGRAAVAHPNGEPVPGHWFVFVEQKVLLKYHALVVQAATESEAADIAGGMHRDNKAALQTWDTLEGPTYRVKPMREAHVKRNKL